MNPKEPAVGSETPRTDAKEFEAEVHDSVMRRLLVYVVNVNFARELERELAACRAELGEANRHVNELNEVLRQAGWGQGEIDSAYEMLHKAESRVAPRESEEGLAQRLSKDAYWLEAISADDKYKPADQRDFAETAALLREAAAALRSRSGRT